MARVLVGRHELGQVPSKESGIKSFFTIMHRFLPQPACYWSTSDQNATFAAVVYEQVWGAPSPTVPKFQRWKWWPDNDMNDQEAWSTQSQHQLLIPNDIFFCKVICWNSFALNPLHVYIFPSAPFSRMKVQWYKAVLLGTFQTHTIFIVARVGRV